MIHIYVIYHDMICLLLIWKVYCHSHPHPQSRSRSRSPSPSPSPCHSHSAQSARIPPGTLSESLPDADPVYIPIRSTFCSWRSASMTAKTIHHLILLQSLAGAC